MGAVLLNEGPAQVDYMVPAKGQCSMSSNWAKRLLDTNFDVGCMRPYIDANDPNKTYISKGILGNDGEYHQTAVPTNNDTNATLTIRDWITLDKAVREAAKPRLKVAKDLISRGLTYRVPYGISKSILQYQQQSDITGATISMDGMRRSENDRPIFSTVNFPLPIIHKDFSFSLRQVLESRNGQAPLDTTTAKLASRRVAEQVEQLALGCTASNFEGVATYSYGGASIYGYMNYPGRITTTITSPLVGGWTPDTLVNEVLQMIKVANRQNFFGPWQFYYGINWSPYMNDDYKPTYDSTTLAERILKIKDVAGIEMADYIPDYSLIMVQMTDDVVRMVIAMDLMVVQWQSPDGMELHYKVMCVMLPQLQNDFYGNVGVVHANI